MPTDTPPRRNWHLTRWLIVFIVAMFGWRGWRAHAFRSALAEAKALGWTVEYHEPLELIWANWKLAFEKETWMDGVTNVQIPTSEKFEQHLTIVHRLNPKVLQIDHAATLRDLSTLKPLNRLQAIQLNDCMRLTNVDALKNLSTLRSVALAGCTGLTNVDALKNLSTLGRVALFGCKALTNVDAIKDLSALEMLYLRDCTRLTNVDALKNLTALQVVDISDCTRITNVDGLKNLSALRLVRLDGCMGLTKERISALKAALPKATITSSYY